MQPGDKICIGGQIFAPEAILPEAERLLGSNYIWQDIHTLGYRSPYIGRHLEIAARSLEVIHGTGSVPDVADVAATIEELLRQNRYPAGSNLIRLYLLPGMWMLVCRRQMVYEGLVLWHNRPQAVTVQYESPFPGHQCAVSLMCGSVADDYAVRCGAEMALTENRDGILTGAGDLPLIGIRERTAYITPPEYGATESVYRDIAAETFKKAEMELIEEPLPAGAAYDEMLIFSPTGITSLKGLNGENLFNTTALKLSLALPKF